MSKPTPGPWAVVRYAGHKPKNDYPGSIEASNGQKVFAGPFSFRSLRGSTPEEAEANARLISAAPELLAYAECEQAHRESLLPSTKGGTGNSQSYFETFNKHGWNGRDLYGFLDGLRRAAISKAKGKS